MKIPGKKPKPDKAPPAQEKPKPKNLYRDKRIIKAIQFNGENFYDIVKLFGKENIKKSRDEKHLVIPVAFNNNGPYVVFKGYFVLHHERGGVKALAEDMFFEQYEAVK